MKKFCEKLQELRKAHKLTQTQLADIIGRTQVSVSQWEKGIYFPPTDILKKLTLLFNVDYEYFLSDTEKPIQAEFLEKISIMPEADFSITDDLMWPFIPKGAAIYINKKLKPLSGDYVLIQLTDSEKCVRQYINNRGKKYFQTIREERAPILINKKIKIIGVVTKALIDFRQN
jgi:transcriptional regulator with XRE-family HTH domain